MPRSSTGNASGNSVTAPTGTAAGAAPLVGGISKSPRNGQRLSRFVFTLNNYTLEEEAAIQATCEKQQLTWLIYGHEKAPTTGTPHLQGACVIGKQRAFSTIKKWPGFERMSIHVMNGSCEQNKTYCTKEDKTLFFEHGEFQEPGKRNDLLLVVKAIKEGRSLRDIVVDDDSSAATYVRYSTGIHRLANLLSPNIRPLPTVIWFHGETGKGKTLSAVQAAERLAPGNWWISGDDLKWFDGYNNHRVAVIDELRYDSLKFAFLLRLLDRYPLQVQIKGGHTQWRPEYIFITCPNPPELEFGRAYENMAQLLRRISLVATIPDHAERVSALLFPEDASVVVPMLPGTAPDGTDSSGEHGILGLDDLGFPNGESVGDGYVSSISGEEETLHAIAATIDYIEID